MPDVGVPIVGLRPGSVRLSAQYCSPLEVARPTMSIVYLYPLKANIVLPTNAELAILRVLWKKGPSIVRSVNVFYRIRSQVYILT